MKFSIASLFSLAGVCSLLLVPPSAAAQEESGFKGEHDAGGIIIEPYQGEFEAGETLTITFPAAMVKTDAIDVAGNACPFVATPKLPGKFLWKSQTEGEFTIEAPLVPGARYRLSLDPALKDLEGKPVKAKNWGAEFTTRSFVFSMESESFPTERLSIRPQVYLSASYPVKFAEAVERIYFQDRNTHERRAAEIVISDDDDTESGKEFRVAPREDLPVGHTFDLVIDGVKDLQSQKPLPHLQVFQLGSTKPMSVEWVAALNRPMESPQIAVKLSDSIDPKNVSPDTIKIEPPVKNISVTVENDQITIDGDFDTATRYSVTVPKDLKGNHGYGLEAESRWKATFKPKAASIIFPGAQIFERSARGLRFSFLQVNTEKVTWKLAPIPQEKLATIAKRLREFQADATDPFTGESFIDPRTGFTKKENTELFVNAFDLKTTGTGTFDATDADKEVLREIEWMPPGGEALSGAYLLEVSGKGVEGRTVGNRSIVCFSDLIITQKRSASTVTLRLAKMSDGQPVAGMPVRALSDENIEVARGLSDKEGMISFPREALFAQKKPQAYLFIADTPAGPAMQYADASDFSSGSFDSSAKPEATTLRSVILTDRNLYRPAQTVKFKGLLRLDTRGELSVPADQTVHWWITKDSRDEILAEGNTPLSAEGGWEGAWEVPAKAGLGDYTVHCDTAQWKQDVTTAFRVDEYRVPLFSVEVDAENTVGAFSQIKVASAYFHGAPNTGSRVHWKATWETSGAGGEDGDSSGGDFSRSDNFTDRDPKLARVPEDLKEAEGDAALDANGMAVIKCDSPFTDGIPRGRCNVVWRVDVTSMDGQTLTAGTSAPLQFVAALPGIRAEEQFKPERSVKVDVDAVDTDNKATGNLEMDVDLYLVTAKTAKEKVGPFIYRYRNTTIYTKVGSQAVKAPGSLVFPVKETGRYVAVAITRNQEHTPQVATETTVSGEEPAEFPVQNEVAFEIKHDDGPFVPGGTAVLHTQAPFGGVAWVSVETNEILDTLLVPLTGNSGRIELPIKKEYGPNVFVSVYLVKPGGAGELPLERFAYTSLSIHVPAHELTVATTLEKETVRPGDAVRGELTVTSGGRPVAGADMLLFAVDDAVLQLGNWSLPDIGGVFYPLRSFGVRTSTSLGNYIAGVSRASLTEKGFVIGDGDGLEAFGNVQKVRKEFRTLAYWEGSLKTDASGKIKFDFTAPDNLTTYRIVAVGQTKENQFGSDTKKAVKISKPLIAEPALPRFLRNDDEVELRLVVRQNFADTDEVTVRCVPDAHLQLTGPAEASQKTVRDVPAVFRFKAKVVDGDFAPTVVKFDAVSKSDRTAYDSVQNTLPVHPPVITRKQSVGGTFQGPVFDPVKQIPDAWKKGRGHYDLTISTTPWLPKITGLPLILDYPHGCFDQISTRMLSYGLLGDLLAYLPDVESRDKTYRAAIESGLKLYDQSILENGMLPYWNGSATPSPFCTVEACWALDEAVKGGFAIPAGLREKLSKAVVEIAAGREKSDPFVQCFALMVASQGRPGENFAAIAQDLYLKRREITDEGRALLALALHQLNIMPAEKAQLLREIDDSDLKERAFDPRTFASTNRAEAIRNLAFCKIAPANFTREKREAMRKKLLTIMDSSQALSTQENLWLLLAFKAFQDAAHYPKLQVDADKLMKLSRNGASAAWQDLPIPPGGNLARKDLNPGTPLSYLMAAEYMPDTVETTREDNGFRVERVVRNLTDPKRTGTAEAPFKLGDQIFITYRIYTRKLQNYVALEDQLPAGLETVNPDLPLIGKFFSIPPGDPKDAVLSLSHSEMRDQSTLLYFDEFYPGTSVYSVLARATVAGTFRWPSTQVVPMYDSRFSGISPASLCVVAGN